MRINKIELKNFRNHRESSYEFEKGINLILGENGSGKTSILDAIGFALFNMKLRSDAVETLTINETSGHVRILFTGNDDTEYVVTRKFPAGTVSLSMDGAKLNITGVNEVYSKINTLIGNTSENPALFENVIVASQNKFTSIFDAKPAERESVFNAVFGTEIYRQLYKGLLKESCDIYDRKLTFAGGELESKLSQLKNSNDLEKIRLAAEKEYSSAQKVSKKNEKKIEDTEKEIRKFEMIKNRKEKLLIELNGITQQIEDKKRTIEAVSADLKIADGAVLIEKELKPEHEKYEKLKTDQDVISKEIADLEKLEKEMNKNRDEIAELETGKATAVGDIKALNQQMENDNSSAELLRSGIEKLKETGILLDKEKSSMEQDLSSLLKRKTEFDDLYKMYKDAEKNGSNKGLLASKAEESVSDEEPFLSAITEYEAESIKLEESKALLDSLNTDIRMKRNVIEGLNDARTELSKQTCPYLKEQCKNIESAGSIDKYFDPRINELEKKITGLKKEAESYNNLAELIKKCSDNKNKKNEQLAAIRKSMQDSMKYRKEESEFKLKTAEYALSISKLFAGTDGKDALCISGDDYEGAAAVMHGAESAFRTRLSAMEDSLKEKREEYKKLENDLKATMLKTQNAEKKKREIERNVEDSISIIKIKNEAGQIYKEKTAPLAGLKKQAAEYSVKLKELEPVDQKYRSAAQTASGRPELQNRHESEIKSVNALIEKHKTTNAEHDAAIYDEKDHKTILTSVSELKLQQKEHNEAMINLKSAYDVALQLEESNKKLEAELEDKKTEIDALKRKKEMADLFRENIKLLGPYISERRTKMIAAAATDNFQRMTGRGERILWENNIEPYIVYIASGSGKRRFNMLSGGEQVAVALSIRSALASEMTDCRFAIFDEPTINLDAEKREALSVSLYDMLKNLEQALVVTHDSTFREMATKVIEL